MSITTSVCLLLLIPFVTPFCWKPNINPFTGPPDTQRVERDTGDDGGQEEVVLT